MLKKIIKEKYSLKNGLVILLMCIIISIGLGILFELGCNYRVLKYKGEKNSIYSISEFEISGLSPGNNALVTGDDGGKIILTNIDGYVRNLQINSFSTKDFNYTIKYVAKNIFGKEETYTIKAPSSYKLNMTSEFIDKYIHDVEISVDEPDITLFNIQIDNNYYVNYYRIFFVAIVVLLIMLFIIFHKTDIFKLEYIFLLISITMGTMIIMCVPNTTFYSYDDETHYYANLAVLNKGEIKYTDAENQMTVALPFSFGTISSNAEKKVQNNYLNVNDNDSEVRNGMGFSKISVYFPGAISHKVTKALNLKFTTRFKVGKFVNLIIYSLLCFFAIKIAKRFKKILFVLSLLPTTVWLASNYSYDPLLTGCILLSSSMMINLFVSDNKSITFLKTIPMFIIFLWGCLTKAVYFPLLLIAFMIPKDKFKSTKDRRLFRVSICLMVVILILSVVFPIFISSKDNVSVTIGDTRGGSDVNGGEQIISVFRNPLAYILTLKDNAFEQFLLNLTGANTLNDFGYAGVGKNNVTTMILLVLLFVALTDNKDRKNKDFPKWFKVFLIFNILLTIILVWSSMYVLFTPVKSELIKGVQNRYFIPLLLPILILINSCRIKHDFDDKKYKLIISLFCLYFISSAVYNLLLLAYCL